MIRQAIIESLRNLAEQLGSIQDGSQWYLFGSVSEDNPDATDIDLLILCKNDDQADTLRQMIDPDDFLLPLDLGLMTFDEADQTNAVRIQGAIPIYPHCLSM